MDEEVKIELVDALPMVNVTDSFLVTREARSGFKRDLLEFFPYCKEKYWLPRLLKEAKSQGRICLFAFARDNDPRYLRNTLMPEVLGDKENQERLALDLLGEIDCIERMRETFSLMGCRILGAHPEPNVFSLSCYKELFST